MLKNAAILAFLFVVVGHSTFGQSLMRKESTSLMEDDTSKFLISWAQTTFGFSLSTGERILHGDQSVIVIGEKGLPSWVVSTYDFNPSQLSTTLQMQLFGCHSLILSAFGTKAMLEFHQIPQWLGSFTLLNSLSLWNADLSAFAMCKGFPIRYLDLREVRCLNPSLLTEVICSMKDLELFIHDDSISEDAILTLKKMLPKVTFIRKAK
jgi:hypothetical protein